MSMKDNVDYIKKEMSTEEGFLESVFKLEKFYKKYKTAIFGTVAVVLLAAIGFNVKNYMDEKNLIEANEAFNKVLEDPKDSASLEILKSKNEKLYELALLSRGKSKTAELDFFKELSMYSKAIEEQSSTGIGQVSQKQNFLLKDFAIFNKALIEAKEGKYKQAKESLKLIPQTSDVNGLAKMLEHYLLTK